MHQTLAQLPEIPPENYYLIINNDTRRYTTGSCKDYLIFRLEFNNTDFAGDLRFNSDVFYTFHCEDFAAFKAKVCAIFKLFTKETPCFFYKHEKDKVVIRLKYGSFFRQHWSLTDFFTIVIRLASIENTISTKEELLNEFSGFSWTGYTYNSILLTQIINNFDRFLEIVNNPANPPYLDAYYGLRNLYEGLALRLEVYQRDEFGNLDNFKAQISPTQELIDFLDK